MVKVQSFSFEQCFGAFTMFLVKVFSQTGPFGHLSNHVFRIPYVQKYISYESDLFLKMFIIKSKFTKCRKEFRRHVLFLR